MTGVSPRPSPPSLSLVILCYRAGESVREFIDRVERLFREQQVTDYELVLVGNYVQGTGDRTPAVVEDIGRKNPRVVSSALPKKGWMGWDMRCGLSLARGQYLAVIDGDGQMPIADVLRVYDKIRAEQLDLVKTYRIQRGDGLVRKCLSYGYNFLFRLLFPGVKARDINSKPKILTRQAYELMELKADDWFVDAEIMIQARRCRMRIGEVPTTFLGLEGRRSFVTAGAVLEFLRNLLAYRLREFTEARPRGRR